MSSVYNINKGINKPVEFKGFKAQYIWYLGGGLILLLILFAVLYICGLHPFICLGIIVCGGTGVFVYIGKLSATHGAYGMMKKMAKKGIPKIVKSNSRKVFKQRGNGKVVG